jgi:fucose permease
MNKPGLAVLAVGCLLFWPSGVKKSFGGFCGSIFVRDTQHSSIILL